ncbi:hypothetical protein BVRB_2g032330 [Beta vulgaris subsp. vulgaris]|nr:hypothetical protein BVRB_2g032330 [Beta vulgaris subsp. vulgaris]
MEDSKIRIEKFDGTDFGYWKMQIEDILYQKNLYQPLSEKPAEIEEAKWKVLDRQAVAVVRLTLARTMVFNVKDIKTTAGLIKALSDMYEKPSAMNKVYLMRLTAVSNSSGKEKLVYDVVRDLILSESIRRKESGESSGAYSAEGRGRGKGRNFQGKSESKGDRSKSKGRASVTCWGCGNEGHLKRDCPKKENGKGKKKFQESDDEEEASTNLISEYDSDALMVSMDDQEELVGCSASWVLDSGSSHHSSPCRELFRNFKSEKLEKVYLADGKAMEVMGKGDVSVKLTHGGSLELKNVKFIPRLKKNLISVANLLHRVTRLCLMVVLGRLSREL